MPTTRPRVPGWHPDPDDPSSLRHWDGRRWGPERRPRPSWARSAKPAEGGGPGSGAAAPGPAGPGDEPPAGPGRRRRWLLLAAGALVVAALVVAVPAWLDTTPDIPPRTVADTSFTRRADAVCAEALPALRRDRPEARQDTGTPAALARRIERAADGLEGVAGRLRALPVAAADRAEVEEWLRDWDAYVALGRRYADRVRAEDDGAVEEVGKEGNAISRRIFVFARSNGMPGCFM